MTRSSCDCVVDPTRPCGCCAAPSRDLCPYPYLLGWADAAPAAEADDSDGSDGSDGSDEPVTESEPDRTSQESEAVQVRTAGPSSLT